MSGDLDKPVWDILTEIFQKTGHTFVFVMDEWDAVFHMAYITDADKEAYLRFLKLLLKGKRYAELVYMTGVLPIVKYSSGSKLNMFVEYDMVTSEKFSGYFGFLDGEVDRLYNIYEKASSVKKFDREDLRIWYDGSIISIIKRGNNMREMEFKMERPGLLKAGDHITVTEGVLPSSYYYTIDPSLAMSGNFPFNQRMLEREGEVAEVIENDRGFYVKARFG